MWIDYVVLMLVNMAAGLLLLGLWVYWGLGRPNQKLWVAPFAIVGLVAMICGFNMSMSWPLPGSYNVAFGETSALLGAAFAGAALALAFRWSVLGVALYGMLAAVMGIIVGIGIIARGMTAAPLVAGWGYILTGAGGVLLPAAIARPRRLTRLIVCLILVAAGLVWLVIAYPSAWMHLDAFATYKGRLIQAP